MSLDQLKRSLLSRLPDHPDAQRMAVVITESFAAAEQFEGKRRELDAKGHLTPRGRHEALKEALTKQYARDLRDAQKPIAEAKERLRTMREAVKVRPSADANNVVAEMRRRELRDAVAAMSDDERVAYVLSVKDNRIVEALLDQPAVVTSIPQEIFDKAEAAYVERVFGKELQEIKAFEAIISEAEAAAAVARDEMQRTIGLERKQFDDLVVPIETKARAPWLLREGDRVVVVKPGESRYPVASPDELRDGRFYTDLAEYERENGRVPEKAA